MSDTTPNQVQTLANHNHENLLNKDDVSKSLNIKSATPKKHESSPVNGVKSDSPKKVENGIVNQKDKPAVDTSNDVKNSKQDINNSTGNNEEDPYAGLEWKDGIATLPGIYVYRI